MKTAARGIIAAVGLMLGAASALAASSGVAQISAMQGRVLVNQGEGFAAITGPVVLNAGDKVMVGEEGSAQISYLLGNCQVSVAASSLVTISDAPPCKGGKTVGAVDTVFVNATADVSDVEVVEEDNNTALLVLGGIAGTALVLCLVEFCDDDGDDDDDDDDDDDNVSKP